jgi:hypothetical protein
MRPHFFTAKDPFPPLYMSVYSTQAQTLDNTLGAVFLGVVVSCMCVIAPITPHLSCLLTHGRRLFGVSALQVYYYYHYHPNDSLLHKLSVSDISRSRSSFQH